MSNTSKEGQGQCKQSACSSGQSSVEKFSTPLNLSCLATGGVRGMPRHGTRSATGKIAKVVPHAYNQLVACRRPRFQAGATVVIMKTSKAGAMYRTVVSAMTTAAGWAGLVQAVIPRRGLSTKHLFGAAGLQEPPPSIPLAEHFSPGTSTNVRVRVQSRLRRHLAQHHMFLVHLEVPGPSKSCVMCEPKSTASSMNEGNQVFNELGLQAGLLTTDPHLRPGRLSYTA